jgi:lipid-A-disaccharide synthase
MLMRLYLIAGEASGDLHGSLLIRELKKKEDNLNLRAWGGDKMKAQGATLVKHYRELAFMGIAEVIKNLRTILQNLSLCKKDILAHRPDALILIDYPGFNLRIAKWAKKQRIPVIYFISPQVWAWKENRVKQMRETIDRMIVILPFEKKYFLEKWNWDVEYVGHPLVEVVDEWVKTHSHPELTGTKKQIAVLPGSRKQEILKKLPVMLELSKHFTDYQFVVAKAPGIEPGFYDELLQQYSNVSSVSGETYQLLSQATAAIVTSGTATLETALFGIPEVVCYKTSNLTYQVGKRLVKVKYISLVNLIMDRPVLKELIQDDMTVENLRVELESLLHDPGRRSQLREDYRKLRELLSSEGSAPTRAAAIVSEFVRSKA